MTLQQNITEKILSENNELRELLLDLVIDVDEAKRAQTKIKENLLDNIRELVYQEEGD
ncbi:hypothetical protein [Vagococcus salmoninarum]|uniref:hypothetical protein n=1 Tax=Vagococcus salmoninarum TaxID=2739 RepID=UPI00187EE761|nr:hypothetical protein [Vagococcus salmoninarum]MBE9389761.1 hypothetical protein [Vagococcus salmoninarum]